MAHTCPECGQLCHCKGDIDDIDFGEWSGCQTLEGMRRRVRLRRL